MTAEFNNSFYKYKIKTVGYSHTNLDVVGFHVVPEEFKSHFIILCDTLLQSEGSKRAKLSKLIVSGYEINNYSRLSLFTVFVSYFNFVGFNTAGLVLFPQTFKVSSPTFVPTTVFGFSNVVIRTKVNKKIIHLCDILYKFHAYAHCCNFLYLYY